ncbi:hypothetical protein PINS_up022264 [Pythium insidiosum]|nr:hypothetical protein PINS_up022264 [Pythium insidiosum]
MTMTMAATAHQPPPPQAPTAQRWPQQFLLGIAAAVTGCLRALTDPKLRAAFTRSAVQLLLWSLGLIALVHAVVWPLEWTLSWLLPQAWIDASLRALRLALTSGIPFMLVTTCRYVQVELFETAFFAGLAQRDPALASSIRSREAIYWDWEYVRHAAVVAAQQLLFGLVFVVISPVFGRSSRSLASDTRSDAWSASFGCPYSSGFAFRPRVRWHFAPCKRGLTRVNSRGSSLIPSSQGSSPLKVTTSSSSSDTRHHPLLRGTRTAATPRDSAFPWWLARCCRCLSSVHSRGSSCSSPRVSTRPSSSISRHSSSCSNSTSLWMNY